MSKETGEHVSKLKKKNKKKQNCSMKIMSSMWIKKRKKQNPGLNPNPITFK